MIYRVVYATARRDWGLLRVTPEVRDADKSGKFMVEGEPDKILRFRVGRVIFDEDNNLLEDRIFIVERPDFDVTSIIGKRIVSA